MFTQEELELLAQALNTALCSRSYSRDKVDALNALADKVVSMQEAPQEEEQEEKPCTNPSGHYWHPDNLDDERSGIHCAYCGADGDA